MILLGQANTMSPDIYNQIFLELVAAASNDVYCAATGAAANVT